jgi:ribosomal protein L44E
MLKYEQMIFEVLASLRYASMIDVVKKTYDTWVKYCKEQKIDEKEFVETLIKNLTTWAKRQYANKAAGTRKELLRSIFEGTDKKFQLVPKDDINFEITEIKPSEANEIENKIKNFSVTL